jgi:cell division protein FtsL
MYHITSFRTFDASYVLSIGIYFIISVHFTLRKIMTKNERLVLRNKRKNKGFKRLPLKVL